MMQEQWVTRLMERFIEWGLGSGGRVLLVGMAMVLLLAIVGVMYDVVTGEIEFLVEDGLRETV